MVRKSLNPLGIPEKPNIPSSKKRQRELVEEYKKWLAFLTRSYKIGSQSNLDMVSFYKSVARLKKEVSRKTRTAKEETRLHPMIELEITRRAGEIVALTEASSLKGLTNRADSLIRPGITLRKSTFTAHDILLA